MSYDAWSGKGRALPRVEELPVAEQGYERDAVRQAFDAFYRHIAQLDSTLRTLEAVDIFHRQAGELRNELRALRSAGWTQQPWSTYAAIPTDRRVRTLVPPALPRIATEIAFIVAVAVVAGVGHFSTTLIVALMLGAWAIVAAIEWFAARERIPPPTAAPAPPVIEGTLEPAPQPLPSQTEPEPEPQPAGEYGWSAFSEAVEAVGADAMTIAGGMPQDEESDEPEPIAEQPEPVGEQPEPVGEEPEAAGEEPEPVGEEPEPVSEEPEEVSGEPVVSEEEPAVAEDAATAAEEPIAADPDGAAPRRRWFRRQRHAPDEREAERAPEPIVPRNVRVLSPEEREERRWADEGAAAEADVEPDESTDENAVGPLRRFRRR